MNIIRKWIANFYNPQSDLVLVLTRHVIQTTRKINQIQVHLRRHSSTQELYYKFYKVNYSLCISIQSLKLMATSSRLIRIFIHILLCSNESHFLLFFRLVMQSLVASSQLLDVYIQLDDDMRAVWMIDSGRWNWRGNKK